MWFKAEKLRIWKRRKGKKKTEKEDRKKRQKKRQGENKEQKMTSALFSRFLHVIVKRKKV